MDQKDQIQLCDPYVWEDPRYIFRSTWFDRYLSESKSVCASSLVNKILFVYIVAALLTMILGLLKNIAGLPLFVGLVATVYLIPTFVKLQQLKLLSENFTDSTVVGKSQGQAGQLTRPQAWGPMPDDLTGPKAADAKVLDPTNVNARNPFHNVMIDEYKYAPTRPGAPDITTVDSKTALDHFFRVQWSSDPTDVFGKTQSQRMFVTQPSSTIPNDQTSYQNWLYKIPGKTCKEGNAEACYGGTNGAALPWLNL